MFAKIAKAYEVLSSKLMRNAYNYFQDHPEEHMTNTMNHYYAVYQPKVPPWWVLVCMLFVLSLLQYLNNNRNYATTMRYIKTQPAFLRRVNERTVELVGKNKVTKIEKAELREQAEQEIMQSEVTVDGGGAPSISDLLIVQAVLLPYYGSIALYEQVRWTFCFTLMGQDYGAKERLFLTQRALHIPVESWDELEETTQEALMARCLWDQGQMDEFQQEEKETERRGRKGLLTVYKRSQGNRINKKDDQECFDD